MLGNPIQERGYDYMIRVVAKFNFKPEEKEKAMVLCKELVDETRKETGCKGYDLAQSANDENQYVVLETWENQEVLDVHSASEHFTRIVPQLVEMSAAAPILESYMQVI